MDRKNWLKGKKKPRFKPPRDKNKTSRLRTASPLWVAIPYACYFIFVGLMGNLILFALSYPKLYVMTFGDQWSEERDGRGFIMFLCLTPWVALSSIWRINRTIQYQEERNSWLLQFNRYLTDISNEPIVLPWTNR